LSATAFLKSDQPNKASQVFANACLIVRRALHVVRIEVLRINSYEVIRNTRAQSVFFEVNNAPSLIV